MSDPENYQPGDRVRYTPTGETGVVRSMNDYCVFVVYDNLARGKMLTLQQAKDWTAAGTLRRDLERLTP